MVMVMPPPVISSAMSYCLHLLLALAVSAGITCGLRLRSLQVPNLVYAGSAVVLACLFDPEQDVLYSVKWYKDDVEFFRHLPNDSPPNQFFDIGDVEVDMSRSSNGTVYLRNMSLSAEGTYRCEVSADAPSFRSISMEKFMAVEVLQTSFSPEEDCCLYATETNRDRPPAMSLSSLGPAVSWMLILLLFLCH